MQYEGEFVKVRSVRIDPTPVQDPIPVWVTAQSPDSVKWAAAYDYPVMQIGESLDQGRGQVERYHAAAEEAGVEVLRGGVVPLRQVFVAESDEIATSACEDQVHASWDAAARTTAPKGPAEDAEGYEYWKQNRPQRHGALGYEGLNRDGLIMTGSPATVVEAVRRQIDALDCKHIMLDFWRPSPRTERVNAMRLFAKEVMPAFRNASVGA